MKLGNVKIGTRLFAGFGVMLILTAALGIVSFVEVGSMKAQNETMDFAAEIHTLALQTRQQEKNYVMREDQASIDKVAKSITGLKNAEGRKEGRKKSLC